MISTCELGQTRGSAPTETPFCRGNPLWLPPARRVAHVENLTHRHLPIAEPKFTKSRTNENPLLKVPPASRGNRVGARLGSPREAEGTYGGGQFMNFGRAIGIRGEWVSATERDCPTMLALDRWRPLRGFQAQPLCPCSPHAGGLEAFRV